VICDFLEAHSNTAKNIKAMLASTKAQWSLCIQRFYTLTECKCFV